MILTVKIGDRLVDFFELFGVPRNADKAAIRRAYLALIKQWHPDHCDHPLAERAAKTINEIYEILKDDTKRQQYLAELTAAERPPPPQFINPWGGVTIIYSWTSSGNSTSGTGSW